MAVTLSGSTITFNDSTTQSTALSTTSVLNAVAGGGTGGVGSYALMQDVGNVTTAPNGTRAGSGLTYVSLRTISGTAPSGSYGTGTWRCMGYSAPYLYCCGTANPVTLWMRIS